MKQLIFAIIILMVGAAAYSQPIAIQRMNAMNANAARANAVATEQARQQREAIERQWGKIGPWYSDLNWQNATNMIGKLKLGMIRNEAELNLQQATLAVNQNDVTTSNRVEQLKTYLVNQKAALSNVYAQKAAVEAKYKLQELNSKPRTK